MAGTGVYYFMPISAQMVIDNASVLACYFGLSDLIVGLTVLAIGTSLPELATLVAEALKGENDIALGNVIGSNIFNSVIVLGVPTLLSPGPFNPDAFARDYWVMLAASVTLAALFLRKRRRINRLSGALLVCGFIAYLVVQLI